MLTVALEGKTANIDVQVAGLDKAPVPDFVRDIAPMIARAGCNAGTCHGAQAGKNGFKLSLRGYDPVYDVRALTDDLSSRRVNIASPAQSLMLLKPTAAVPHTGGQAIKPGSVYYEALREWIAGGAQLNLTSPRVSSIKVTPNNPVIESIGARQQVRVVATYTDGIERDVTREAFVESGNTDVVKTVPDHPGLLESLRRGEAAALVRYEGKYAATTLTVMGDRSGFAWEQPAGQQSYRRTGLRQAATNQNRCSPTHERLRIRPPRVSRPHRPAANARADPSVRRRQNRYEGEARCARSTSSSATTTTSISGPTSGPTS